MDSKFTVSNITLIYLAIIASALLISSKAYYWEIIDLFALPFYETPDFESIESLSNFELPIYLEYADRNNSNDMIAIKYAEKHIKTIESKM